MAFDAPEDADNEARAGDRARARDEAISDVVVEGTVNDKVSWWAFYR